MDQVFNKLWFSDCSAVKNDCKAEERNYGKMCISSCQQRNSDLESVFSNPQQSLEIGRGATFLINYSDNSDAVGSWVTLWKSWASNQNFLVRWEKLYLGIKFRSWLLFPLHIKYGKKGVGEGKKLGTSFHIFNSMS